MISKFSFWATAVLLLIPGALRAEPDWSIHASIPPGGRVNPYNLPPSDFATLKRQGRLHALHYPVSVTRLKIPSRPVQKLLESEDLDPWRRWLQGLVHAATQIRSMDELQDWLGLSRYPEREGEGIFNVPFNGPRPPPFRMGWTVSGEGATIGCAECHAGTLFGRPILGLTNRFSRANMAFARAGTAAPWMTPEVFQWVTGATRSETALYADAREALRSVDVREPKQLGLDTSLAQVALSLARRRADAWATLDPEAPGREEPLSRIAADSKPAVWWNVKYKTRWLSDGSIVSGNPIYTNFLWNEIGRGTDLHELSNWLATNDQVVKELTTAVFSSQAPRWTDFFSASGISEDRAREGERLFVNHCAGCHGTYIKAWSDSRFNGKPWAERMRTIEVRYPFPTRVIDVGTDSRRWAGMHSLEQLNHLEISRVQGIEVVAQKGYVPPPLEGIWARWPYFHNNSAPSLCAVLTAGARRPRRYVVRAPIDPRRDFDSACNGYPEDTTANDPELQYDAGSEGCSNMGHDEGVFLKNGVEVLTPGQKMELISFLQTL